MVCRMNEGERALGSVESLGEWQGPLREWLSIYKYGGDIRMAGYLADRMTVMMNRRWPDIAVVPVPPRIRRLKKDGFDPVGHLASHLEKRGLEVCRILVRRGRGTQKGRDRNERLRAGALDYRLKRNIPRPAGRYVLLDDVMTTGATLEVCASVLLEAGAAGVDGAVVCRD